MRVLAVFLLFLLAITTNLAYKNKKINIVLKAKWPAYPLSSETSEFLARISSEAFWQFFEGLGVIPSGMTDKETYEYLISTASQQLSTVKLSLLKWSLSIHYDNPKIEMYRQLVEQDIYTLKPEEARKLVDCSSWVSSRGRVLCSPDQEKLSDLIDGSGSDIKVYSFDHVYRPLADEVPTVVLYGNIGEASTLQFHEILKKLLEKKSFLYVFRHFFTEKNQNLPRLNLQGYGVELALKSLEYKVIDDTKHVVEGSSSEEVEHHQGDELPVHGFDFNLLTKNYPSSSSELLAFKAHLLSEELDLEKMKVWELKDLALISTQNIISSPDPLRMLRDISQNLPILAHTLARQGISASQRKNIVSVIEQLQAYGTTSNLIWINNTPYDASSLNPFYLYNLLSKQIVNYDILRSLHLKSEDVYKLLSLPVSGTTAHIKINIYSELTDFINDLETDQRYQNWHGHVRDLLQPVWSGQFNYIKKNFYSVVLVVDPASMDGILMTQFISSLIWQNLPARVGFLFDIKDNTSELAVRIWKYTRLTWGVTRWFQYISQLVRSNQQRFSEDDLKKAFEESIGGSYYEVAKEWKEHDMDNYITNTKKFITEKGLSDLSPLFFLNGHLLDIKSTDGMIEPLVSKIFELRTNLQELVQQGLITDDTNIYEFIMAQEEVLGSFNRLILPSANDKPKYVPLFNMFDISYLVHKDAEDMVQSISHLFAVNIDSQQGKQLVLLALDRLNEDNAKNTRIGFVDCGKSILLRAISSILQTNARPKDYLPLIHQLATTEDLTESLVNQLVKKSSIKYNLFESIFGDSQKWLDSLAKQHHFCTSNLELGSNQNAVVTSGRLIILPQETVFSLTDLALLERYEYSTRLKDIVTALEDVTYELDPDLITSPFVSGVAEKTASLLALLSDRTTSKVNPPPIEPSFEVKSGSTTELTIVAILDPLSHAAQRATPVLISLVELFNCSLKVLLNPSRSLSNMPLKNFYRYQMDIISFDENGRLIPGGVASFLNLPQKRLLSTTISVPSSWLVLSSKCKYDLDNIVLDNLPVEEPVLYAEFTLENILVEGSCMDSSNRNIPPRGLELILGDRINPHRQDSLVMSNLGYYQLKANPGIWNLALAPGRASTIYQIKQQLTQEIILTDFIGERELLYVEKRPGMGHMSLFDDLDDNKEKQGNPLWEQLTGLFGGDSLHERTAQKIEVNTTLVEDDTIHIFSLASGHLYERFLKIMILSVMENTKSPVKFWLLSNFLSPAFKDFVPKMAEKYKFQVELVTYKWPVWLHEQTEKQRIIWGYKILFLDVLFPLSLKKVIYVDADQVVRVDLKELRDINLKGAPYGYTPFCSGYSMNPDTTGFRFWDSGYWKEHLGGKVYHISALYVVDLHRLRERGYADQLRATYDGLSKDPNSLANLDQDLPNYLQHMVPIYSLPQEWLWCETWCTIQSKEKAKTIDLCNNPLTKVPKLEAAVRLIPEWQQWDSEIKQFEQSLDKNKSIENKQDSMDKAPLKEDL